jgi:hypothetical protein
MKDDTFSANNRNKDKILNSYLSNKCTRISWLNEPKDTCMDASLFKTYVEGMLQTVQLYKDGMCHLQHYSKLIGTSNTMPIIPIDTGTAKRIRGISCNSRFTTNPNEVDHSKHIYLQNSDFIKEFKEKKCMMDAWFDILASYASRWTNGEEINYSENFVDTKSSIVTTNDTTQDFIDSNLVITDEDKDRIGKTEMLALFKAMYPQKFISPQQLLGDMKNHHIIYQPKYRCDNIQGCYVGVKVRKGDEPDFDDLNNGVKSSDQSIDAMKLLKDENEALKKRIKELENIKHEPQDDTPDGIKQMHKIMKKLNKKTSDSDDEVVVQKKKKKKKTKPTPPVEVKELVLDFDGDDDDIFSDSDDGFCDGDTDILSF